MTRPGRLKQTCLALAVGQALGMPLAQAVTINVDAGCTLIEAIQEAESPNDLNLGCEPAVGATDDTIVLASGSVHTLTSGFDNGVSAPNLFTGTPFITSNITIQGQGSGATIERVSTDEFRLFAVVNDGSLTIENSTLTGGFLSEGPTGVDYSGGGIYVGANAGLTLNDVTLDSNQVSLGNGGGIYSKGGDIVIANSTLSGNSAGEHGGGVSSDGKSSITIKNSTISGNSARFGGGVFGDVDALIQVHASNIENNSSYRGGGLFTYGATTVIIDNSSVSSNTAIDFAGGLEMNGRENSISDTTISDNSANIGGGISTDDATLENVTISGNTASNSAGGIFLTSQASIKINNSTITANIAGSRTGGLLTHFLSDTIDISNSVISGNSSTIAPTEIDNQGATVVSRNNVFGENATNFLDGFQGFSLSQFDINASSDGDATSQHKPTSLSNILAPLSDNGGVTKTHALVLGSPAINMGNNASCTNTDQRGFQRVGRCDMGAFEFNSPGPPVPPPPPPFEPATIVPPIMLLLDEEES